MIQLNPDNMVRVELTAKEQKTLLKYCQSIDSDIYDRIQNTPNGVLNLFLSGERFPVCLEEFRPLCAACSIRAGIIAVLLEDIVNCGMTDFEAQVL